MRFFLIFIACIISTSVYAQTSTAGVDIPANQTFILGEYSDFDYKAKLTNDGQVAITIQLRDKVSKAVEQTFVLKPKQSESVKVAASQIVTMENATAIPGSVEAVLSKTVYGMGYVANEAMEVEQLGLSSKPTPGEFDDAPVEIDAEAGPEQKKVSQQILAGQELIIGEGTRTNYTAFISKQGGDIEVSIRDRRTQQQTQGFGLGNTGKVEVSIGPTEVIHLVNVGKKAAKTTVRFSEPVSGARIANVLFEPVK